MKLVFISKGMTTTFSSLSLFSSFEYGSSFSGRDQPSLPYSTQTTTSDLPNKFMKWTWSKQMEWQSLRCWYGRPKTPSCNAHQFKSKQNATQLPLAHTPEILMDISEPQAALLAHSRLASPSIGTSTGAAGCLEMAGSYSQSQILLGFHPLDNALKCWREEASQYSRHLSVVPLLARLARPPLS